MFCQVMTLESGRLTTFGFRLAVVAVRLSALWLVQV